MTTWPDVVKSAIFAIVAIAGLYFLWRMYRDE